MIKDNGKLVEATKEFIGYTNQAPSCVSCKYSKMLNNNRICEINSLTEFQVMDKGICDKHEPGKRTL